MNKMEVKKGGAETLGLDKTRTCQADNVLR